MEVTNLTSEPLADFVHFFLRGCSFRFHRRQIPGVRVHVPWTKENRDPNPTFTPTVDRQNTLINVALDVTRTPFPATLTKPEESLIQNPTTVIHFTQPTTVLMRSIP